MLPLPQLCARDGLGIRYLTDEDLFSESGVRIAFTFRMGGESTGCYGGLDLATHVGDDPDRVLANRDLLMRALHGEGIRLVNPNQVHGTDLVVFADAAPDVVEYQEELARKGCDGLVVSIPDLAPLLCFADCAPLIIVSSSGSFAVVHAGWRGALAGIAEKAVGALVKLDGGDRDAASGYNAYIGPHIHGECFEVSEEIAQRFVDEYGPRAIVDERHVDLLGALTVSLQHGGVDVGRIVESGYCTRCHEDELFSYRASQGTCGRHGAVAFRR